MFLDSAAKNYPGILQDQNTYATFIFWLTLMRKLANKVNKIDNDRENKVLT